MLEGRLGIGSALGALLLSAVPAMAQSGDPRWRHGFQPNATGALAFLRSLHPTPEVQLKIDFLTQELGSTRFRSRVSAERELVNHGIAATDALRRATLSDDLEVRTRARRALLQVYERGYGTLLQNAFEVLRRTKPPGATAAILDAIPLCTEDRLHAFAARALIAVAGPDDDARLRRALGSPHAVTRTIVVMAVGARRDDAIRFALDPSLNTFYFGV